MSLPAAGGRDARSRARPDGPPVIGSARPFVVRRGDERGQATVEFALVLPLVFALLVLLFQVALVGRDEILVVHAARDAVREATLTSNPARVEQAARRTLPGATVRIVRRGEVGQPVEVRVSYVSRTNLPLVGALLPDVTVRSGSVMRVERP